MLILLIYIVLMLDICFYCCQQNQCLVPKVFDFRIISSTIFVDMMHRTFKSIVQQLGLFYVHYLETQLIQYLCTLP